jgi:hypothetical protein
VPGFLYSPALCLQDFFGVEHVVREFLVIAADNAVYRFSHFADNVADCKPQERCRPVRDALDNRCFVFARNRGDILDQIGNRYNFPWYHVEPGQGAAEVELADELSMELFIVAAWYRLITEVVRFQIVLQQEGVAHFDEPALNPTQVQVPAHERVNAADQGIRHDKANDAVPRVERAQVVELAVGQPYQQCQQDEAAHVMAVFGQCPEAEEQHGDDWPEEHATQNEGQAFVDKIHFRSLLSFIRTTH